MAMNSLLLANDFIKHVCSQVPHIFDGKYRKGLTRATCGKIIFIETRGFVQNTYQIWPSTWPGKPDCMRNTLAWSPEKVNRTQGTIKVVFFIPIHKFNEYLIMINQ